MKNFRVPDDTKIYVRKQGDFAVYLNEILKIKKISKNQFAKTIGISPTYLNKILAGNANLTLKTISKIEAVIGEFVIIQDIGIFYKTL